MLATLGPRLLTTRSRRRAAAAPSPCQAQRGAKLIGDLLAAAGDADCIVTACPLCMFNLNSSRKRQEAPGAPTFNIGPIPTQIMGLAFAFRKRHSGSAKTPCLLTACIERSRLAPPFERRGQCLGPVGGQPMAEGQERRQDRCLHLPLRQQHRWHGRCGGSDGVRQSKAQLAVARNYKFNGFGAGPGLIKQEHRGTRLNRVVVAPAAACKSPPSAASVKRRPEPLPVHICNIREQCSWVHKDGATEKAKA